MLQAVRLVALVTVVLAVAIQASSAKEWNRNCIDKPVGFGRHTTGGAGGRTVVPKTLRELMKYIDSDETLIIDLQQEFDFTNFMGTANATGCTFQKCQKGSASKGQYALLFSETCTGREKSIVPFDVAGLIPLRVRSNTSIISSNKKGGIKGRGLSIDGAENIIIRDIYITDLNAHVVWGGDAITLDQVKNLWIHNVTFARIGRQHIVSHWRHQTGITISSCLFDGTTPTSALCNGHHYWVFLLIGRRDEITLINNHFKNTDGRVPHAGGTANSNNFIHMVGNFFDTSIGHGVEAQQGGTLLVEGNIFKDFRQPWESKYKGGFLAMIDSDADVKKCETSLGRKCAKNEYTNSKTTPRSDEKVFNVFKGFSKEDLAVPASCLKA